MQKTRLTESVFTTDGRRINKYSWRSDEDVLGTGGDVEFLRTAYGVDTPGDLLLWNIATIPTILSAKCLVEYSLNINPEGPQYDGPLAAKAKASNARWTTYTSQPVVMTKCTGFQETLEDAYYVEDDNSVSPLSNVTELVRSYINQFAGEKEAEEHFKIPPLWISSPESPKALLYLFLVDHWEWGESDTLEVCIVNAFWHETLTTLILDEMGTTIQISIPESVEAVAKSNMTIIALDVEVVSSLGVLCGGIGTSPPYGGYLPLCLAQFLSFIPAHRRVERGVEPFNYKLAKGFNMSELKTPAPSAFQVIGTIDGFGHGATDTSIRLSVAVMLAYCIIATLYVSHIIATGHTSIAWDSATELIILALQSKEPAGLGHISVVLDPMETFRKGVGIKVSTIDDNGTGQAKEKLQLVFEDAEETRKRGLTKVRRRLR